MRFGTDFTEADQLFFDQVRAAAERNEKIVEAAKANSEANFSAFFGRILNDLFIQRMDGNQEIFNRVMSDKRFRAAAQDHLTQEVYRRVRQGDPIEIAHNPLSFRRILKVYGGEASSAYRYLSPSPPGTTC